MNVDSNTHVSSCANSSNTIVTMGQDEEKTVQQMAQNDRSIMVRGLGLYVLFVYLFISYSN